MKVKPEVYPEAHFFDHLCGILLSHSPNKPSDRRLVALIQIQRLTQTIAVMKTSREIGEQFGMPLDILVMGFRQKIKDLRQSLSEELILDRKLPKALRLASTAYPSFVGIQN